VGEEKEKRGLLKAELRIEVRDKHGKVVEVREKESDLILDNFKLMLATLMTPEEMIAEGADRSETLVDYGGTARSVPIWANKLISSGQGLSFTGFHRSPDSLIGVRIIVGTSTVSPTRADYALGAAVATGSPTRSVGADYISWAVSITLTTAADIAEAGMSIFVNVASTAATLWYQFLLFRDTFTPVSVPAGGTISVTYTLTL